MRKQFLLLGALVFAVAVSVAMAQTARQNTTTTTQTTTTTTTTGPEHNIEGCIAKEQSDFFLIPQRGEPFRLQAATDLAGQEGHKVRVSGKWLSGSAAQSAEANTNTQSGSVAQQQSPNAGTGNDLHRLSKRSLVVDNVRSIADTCPVNWNPRVAR